MSTVPKNATDGLSGQVAIITGGGRGLGRAFAQTLAAAGVKVAIMARTASQLNETVALIQEAGGTALAFTADVTDRPTMEQIVAEIEGQLGSVDVLVNNAAVATPAGYDWEVDPDEWWRTLEINVRGPYLYTHAVLTGMMARRSGRIVNVSSEAAHSGQHPYLTAYCASKAALTQMTNLLATAVKEYGISVFALSPAGPTTMVESLATSLKIPEQVRVHVRKSIMDGAGIAESVSMLMFLVSGQADVLTGRHIRWWDTPDELLHRADEIIRSDLYAMRLRL